MGWLNLTGLRRRLIYKPLAILMSLLLMPAVSWIDDSRGGPRPFHASAQVIGGCNADPSSKSIIRKYCVTTAAGQTFDYHDALVRLESDAVNLYLNEHGLPASDAAVIYDLGRSDLRSAVRANMLVILLSVIQKTPPRTAYEQDLYNWLSALVQNNEVAMYTNALEEFGRYQSNPCLFTLDPVIASSYNLSYDGIPSCAGAASLFNGTPVPTGSYFRAYGLKKSYGAPADQFPYFSNLVAQTGVHMAEVLGIAWAVAAGIATGITIAVAAAVATGPVAVGIVTTATGLASFGAGLIALGPAAIIAIAIAIGVAAVVQAYTADQTKKDLLNLTNTLNQAKTTAPDLLAFATDSSGLGNYKIQTSFIAQTVPEVASTAALPAHRNAVDMNFAIQNGSSTSLSPTFSYNDWDGNTWAAQTWGGWFVQTCSGASCAQPNSILGSIHYLDWSGVKWTAARFGSIFAHIKAQPASTDKICKADPITGVSPGSDFSACSSYASTSIPLTDSNRNRVRVSLSVWAPPVFTSPTTLPFAPAVSSSQTITATGNPAPTICYSSGNLPAGFTLNGGNCGQGSFQLTYTSSGAPQGLYNLTLIASGYGAPVTQTFTVALTDQLSITSAAAITTVPGVPVNFLVTTTGYPAPSLSLDPDFPWPAGLTFTDNHNGTATISGSLANLGLSQCVHAPTPTDPVGAPCGIIATNAQGSVEQPFAINTNLAPQASVVPPTSATFVAGISNSVVLSSAGSITPVTTWAFRGNPNAPWASLRSNVFDRTATLSGAPPAGTTGSFTVDVAPFALFSASDPGLLLYTPYTINVLNKPVFISANTAAFTVGSFGSFPVSVNMGTISLADTLPTGLSFAAGNPGSINGVAAPGTGGQYTVRLIDDAGTAGSTTQYLSLDVYEQPKITSSNTVNLIAGMPSSFSVTTTGYPNISTHPVPPDSLPPFSPVQGNGMHFTVIGLPSGLQATNLTSQGYAGGTLTIQGTPSAADAGVHMVQITAANAVGTNAQQTLALNIVKITAPTPLSGTTCNGTYNGTFRGNVTVSSGQNCAFVGGGITGNIVLNGGNLSLANASVTGNVNIQGASAFSIGPGTTIGGNLLLQNIASGSTTSRICQARVGGNLQLATNAIPISIGSPETFCYGNSISGNLDIQGNTARITVFDNSVGRNLSCSANISITGGGNSAQRKNGQCAAF
jgi:hypothetical protein